MASLYPYLSKKSEVTESSFSGYLSTSDLEKAVGGTWSFDESGSYNYTVSNGNVTYHYYKGSPKVYPVDTAIGKDPFSYLIHQEEAVLGYFPSSPASFVSGVVRGYHLKFVNGNDEIELDLVNMSSSLASQLYSSAKSSSYYVSTSKGDLYYGFYSGSGYCAVVGAVSTYMFNIYFKPAQSKTAMTQVLEDVATNLGLSPSSSVSTKEPTVSVAPKEIKLPFNLSLTSSEVSSVLGNKWTFDPTCTLNASISNGDVQYLFYNGKYYNVSVDKFSAADPMYYLSGNMKDAMNVSIQDQYLYGNSSYVQIVTFEYNGTQFQAYVLNVSTSILNMLPSSGVHVSKYDTILSFKYDGLLLNLYVGMSTSSSQQSQLMNLLEKSLIIINNN